MTIDTIFERYNVDAQMAEQALSRGAYVLALKKVWVGPEVQWNTIVKALVFVDVGKESAHIRKKVGLDKYTVTLITRGVPKFFDTVAASHDIHQKLFVYCLWRENVPHADIDMQAWENLQKEIESNMLVEAGEVVAQAKDINTILKMNILHYKNPSV